MVEYDFRRIEKKWRKIWKERKAHRSEVRTDKPKHYCLDMFPYPSAEGLHVGHWRGYVLSDVWSRYMKLKGYNILHPMGWDAFGLPAENYALEKGIHPQESTQKNIANMKRQLDEIGAMYDWDREINSSSPDYYHWTQWMFIQLYNKGLAFKKEAPINWCPSCKTGLADEEVVNGGCERCGSEVTKKNLSQWFFRITDYAERLLQDLKDLDWPYKVKLMQANWIGKSEGADIIFKIPEYGEEIEVFTTRPDTLFGATYIVLAPEHPLVLKLTLPEYREKVESYIEKARRQSEVERLNLDKVKTGVFTGSYAINPVNEKHIPIWISDYVMLTYGTGAIMAVPAHDSRDWEFAHKFSLPVIQVILPPGEEEGLTEAYTGHGTMINSGQFTGMSSEECWEKIVDWLQSKGVARRKVNYKLRDWLISRQRYWGAPIPIIYCDDCGEVPVPEEELPLKLPSVERYQPTGTGESPLATISSFVNTVCPRCGKKAKRDTDTISQWVCSSWYFLRYASPKYQDGPFEPQAVRYWLPVDLYVGGIEHAVLHLLYSRFLTKVLYDLGKIDFQEPFLRLFNQGMIYRLGAKMSKSKGNIVNPDTLIEKYGVDSLRAYELFIGPPEQDSEWNDRGIEGVYRWLKRVWRLVRDGSFPEDVIEKEEVERWTHRIIKKVTEDLERLHLNTYVSSLMEWVNFLTDYLRNNPGGIKKDTIKVLLILISPVAPHLAEELWEYIGFNGSIFDSKWPDYIPEKTKVEEVIIVIQVNGKVREKISVPISADEEEVKLKAIQLPKIKGYIDNKDIKRVIYVPQKLINIVIS